MQRQFQRLVVHTDVLNTAQNTVSPSAAVYFLTSRRLKSRILVDDDDGMHIVWHTNKSCARLTHKHTHKKNMHKLQTLQQLHNSTHLYSAHTALTASKSSLPVPATLVVNAMPPLSFFLKVILGGFLLSRMPKPSSSCSINCTQNAKPLSHGSLQRMMAIVGWLERQGRGHLM